MRRAISNEGWNIFQGRETREREREREIIVYYQGKVI